MKPNFVFKVRLLTNYTDFLQTTYLLTTSQGGNHCIAWEQGRGNDVVVIVKEKKLGKTPHILLCKKEKKKRLKKKIKKITELLKGKEKIFQLLLKVKKETSEF